MTPSQMLLETFDSLMVILVKLDQRLYKLEGHNARFGERTDSISIKEEMQHAVCTQGNGCTFISGSSAMPLISNK